MESTVVLLVSNSSQTTGFAYYSRVPSGIECVPLGLRIKVSESGYMSWLNLVIWVGCLFPRRKFGSGGLHAPADDGSAL